MVTHKIRYDTVEGRLIPGDNPLLPIIRTYSDSMAAGGINFNIFEATKHDTISAQIYKANKRMFLRWVHTVLAKSMKSY